MNLSTITGVVNGITLDINMESAPTEADRTAHFKIGNQSVKITSRPLIANGDHVTAVGIAGAEFTILGIRNNATQVTFWIPEMSVSHAVVWIVLGVCLLTVIIGIFFLIKGVKLYQKSSLMNNALKQARVMMQNTPVTN